MNDAERKAVEAGEGVFKNGRYFNVGKTYNPDGTLRMDFDARNASDPAFNGLEFLYMDDDQPVFGPSNSGLSKTVSSSCSPSLHREPLPESTQSRKHGRDEVSKPEPPLPKQEEPVASYGIIDPDYARVFTMARCLAWAEGYALAMHGSFTRDLDLIAVPWANHACEPEHLARRIEDVAGLRISVDPKNDKPHGRLVWTLVFPGFGDPRFVDLSILPRESKADNVLPGSEDMERREAWLRDKAADMGYELTPARPSLDARMRERDEPFGLERSGPSSPPVQSGKMGGEG